MILLVFACGTVVFVTVGAYIGDLGARLHEAGYRNVWTPFAEMIHHESASRGRDRSGENLARLSAAAEFMSERWGDRLAEDPAYNPNLTLTGEPFMLAAEPRAVRPWSSFMECDHDE